MVSHIVSRSEYNKKEDVFAATIYWFAYEPNGRAKHVEEFMTDLIRLPQFSSSFLTDVVLCKPLFKGWNVSKLKHLVCDAFAYHATTFKDLVVVSGGVFYLKQRVRPPMS